MTFSRSRDNWAAISGTSGGVIFYEGHLFGTDAVAHGMTLT